MASNETNNAFTTNANIKQFGGNGDGINSDVPAFRLALKTLSVGQGKNLSALLLPPGTYRIPAGTTIIVPTGLTIKGSGDDAVIRVDGPIPAFQGADGSVVNFENLRFEGVNPGSVAVAMVGPTGTLQLNHVTGDSNATVSIPDGINFIQADCNEIGQDVDVVNGGPYSITHLGDGLWVGSNHPRQIKGDIDPSAPPGYAAPMGSIFQSTDGKLYVKTGPLDTDWVFTAGVPTPLANFNPTQVDSGDAADPGLSGFASRGDHQHAVPLPTVVAGLTPASAADVGVSTVLAREDHVHGMTGFSGPVPPLEYTVFVGKNGNDGTADGSIEKPFLTVQAAMEYAWTTYVAPIEPQPVPPFRRPCVFVSAGTYDDGPLVLPPQICVMGEGRNHSRITGNWSIDARWSNAINASDFRSAWIMVGLFGAIDINFDTFASNEGKIYADVCRFGGTLAITQKTANPSSNQGVFTDCEFLGDVTINSMPILFQACVGRDITLTLNQQVGGGVDNLFETAGGRWGNIVINSTSGLAPVYACKFSHLAEVGTTLTLNGTFSTVNAVLGAVPLQANIILLGGATLQQILRINPPFFSGPTADRPATPYTGQEFFDTTIDQTVWWDGAAWVTWVNGTSTGNGFINWGNDNVGAAADTRYLNPGSGGVATLTAGSFAVPIPHPGTLRNLFVRHNAASGNGNSVVYAVLVNGVATGITVTLATGAVGQASDLVNTFAVVAGDRVELRATKALGIGGAGVQVDTSVEIS